MNNTCIPKLSPIYCSGEVASITQCQEMERRFTGHAGEKVCIYLKKPRKRTVSISERHPAPRQCTINPDRYIFDKTLCLLSGTTKLNKIVFRRRDLPRPKPYSSIGFNDKLQVIPLYGKPNLECNVYKNLQYRYSTVDLKGILTSKCRFSHDDDDEDDQSENKLSEINCVIQQKFKAGLIEEGSSDSMLESLCTDSSNPFELICNLINTKLPTELYMNILKYMNYDQVKWLADKDEAFLRELASKRYNIVNSQDKSEFPDIESLLPIIRKNAASEMRFSQDEDMWLASFGDTKNPGIAKRLAVAPGIYIWHTMNAITRIRYNTSRSFCEDCAENLSNLQNAMAKEQELMMKGNPQMKIFMLEGSEGMNIDSRYTSPFYRGSTVQEDYDYSLHMWTDNLENRWLQDVQMNNEWLELEEYQQFMKYKTMIFKDPVKFFGTHKYLDYIDNGILAFTSKLTGEVVGYLVEDEEYRLRAPSCDNLDTHQPKITGLNFLSPSYYQMIIRAKHLVKHVMEHETVSKINNATDRVVQLEAAMLDPTNDIASLQSEIDTLEAYINFEEEKFHGDFELNLKTILNERMDRNRVHIHEVYHEDIDFCTKFSLNRLGESEKPDVIKSNARALFTYCSYEKENPEKVCSLKAVNPYVLHSLLVVKTGLSKTCNPVV